MRDRAHEIADRVAERQQRQDESDQRQRREPLWRQGAGELTEADDRQLGAAADLAYRRGRGGERRDR